MEVKSGYKQTEIGVIPKSWNVATIREHASIKTGKKNTQDHVADGLYPFFVRSQTIERINSYSFDGEAVLTAGDGVGTGKVFHYIQGRFDYHQRVYCISNFSLALSGFYFYLYFSTHFYDRIMSMTAKSSVDSVRLEMIADMLIPMPPLEEQQAIAAALVDVDGLIESLERLIAKKRDLKQAAMQQLLTGQTRLPGFKGEWDPRVFGELATPRKERIDPQRAKPEVFCVELEQIESGTGRVTSRTDAAGQLSQKSVFRVGDVLFGKLRAYLRKYWLADRPGICSTEIWVLAANTQFISSEYLRQIVATDTFIDVASTAYGTHMPRSDWNVVRKMEVAMPSLAEQTAIAAVLSDMDAEIAALEARRDKTRLLKQGMMQELLTGKTRLV